MEKIKKVTFFLTLIFVLSVFGLSLNAEGKEKVKYNAVYGKGDASITIATGSPGALGLLKALADPFCEQNDCKINWIKKGSGASLAFMKAGKCDLIMVHAPEAEKKAVQEGWAAYRTLIGFNEFYIVGPKDDPAKISKAKSAKEAYSRIARAKAKFYSRGDNSGTHRKEMRIWGVAGIKPSGSWYITTNDFMGPTLMEADREKGYFMTDSSTYYVKKTQLKEVVPLFKGDPLLVNIYHALVPNPVKYPQRNEELAVKFVEFVATSEGQEIFKSFGTQKYGQPLYNNAETTIKLEGKGTTKTKPIRIAVEFTTHSACAHIANQKGWYKEEGLTISSYENFITGMALAVALARGDIDAAYICLIPAINAKANARVPIKIVAGIHKYGYGFVVNPDKVKTIEDLKKKGIRIGCSREGGPLDSLLHKMIEKYHLDKKQILKKVRRMNPPKLLLALKTGQLDAAFICEQFPTMAEELGFKVFLTAQDLWPNMQGSVLVVREELIKEYPDIVKKLVKVTERATQFINSHPEEAAEIVAGELQIAGKKIFPVKAIDVVSKLVITPRQILKSLTVRLVNTTDIDPKQIQKAIDTCVELEYIKEPFKAENFIELTGFIK